MNKVEEFIEKQDKIIKEARDKTLIELGLFEKEYAPDGKESYLYPKRDYGNRYYREVAISVTDEEFNIILEKVEKVKGIKAKNEAMRESRHHKGRIVKRWLPIFAKAKDSNNNGGEEEHDDGISKKATIIRIVYYLLVVLALFASGFLNEDFKMGWLYVLIGGVAGALPIEGMISILDYLAELLAIMRSGYKYSEKEE